MSTENPWLLLLKRFGPVMLGAVLLCTGGYVIAKTIAHSAAVSRERDEALAQNTRDARLRDSVLAFASARQAEADSNSALARRESERAALTQGRLNRALEALHIAQNIPLPVTATPSDSAAAYRLRYERASAALTEALALNITKDNEITALRAGNVALQASVDRLTTQLATTERENAARLAAVLKKMQPPCRLGFLPCPPRAVSFVGGVTLGVLLIVLIR
jgi:hypothetical protein